MKKKKIAVTSSFERKRYLERGEGRETVPFSLPSTTPKQGGEQGLVNTSPSKKGSTSLPFCTGGGRRTITFKGRGKNFHHREKRGGNLPPSF